MIVIGRFRLILQIKEHAHFVFHVCFEGLMECDGIELWRLVWFPILGFYSCRYCLLRERYRCLCLHADHFGLKSDCCWWKGCYMWFCLLLLVLFWWNVFICGFVSTWAKEWFEALGLLQVCMFFSLSILVKKTFIVFVVVGCSATWYRLSSQMLLFDSISVIVVPVWRFFFLHQRYLFNYALRVIWWTISTGIQQRLECSAAQSWLRALWNAVCEWF